MAAALLVLWITAAPRPPVPLPTASSTVPFAFSPGMQTFNMQQGIETWYRDDRRPFLFRLPQGFSAKSYPIAPAGAEAVLVADDEGDGLVILITPAPGAGPDLTVQDVASLDPHFVQNGAVAVEIAPGAAGVAFTAEEDPLWQQPAAELWFYYRGDRYQISAPAADAGLIDFIWNAWIWQE